MLKYSPDFTVSAKKSKSKGLDAVSQIQSITGKRAEKNFEPMQQNWFPLISSLARWCDRRGLLAHSPSFVSWIRPWTYRQWMEKQQLRRAAEPLVGLWILGISCLPCGVCSIEIHFLSGTWDTSHIRYQLHHCICPNSIHNQFQLFRSFLSPPTSGRARGLWLWSAGWQVLRQRQWRGQLFWIHESPGQASLPRPVMAVILCSCSPFQNYFLTMVPI